MKNISPKTRRANNNAQLRFMLLGFTSLRTIIDKVRADY